MIDKKEINGQIEFLRLKLQLISSQANDLTVESIISVSWELDEAINAYYRNNAVIKKRAGGYGKSSQKKYWSAKMTVINRKRLVNSRNQWINFV